MLIPQRLSILCILIVFMYIAVAVLLYSRVPNNRRGWNNREGGLDIVIIIDNRVGWNNRGGWTGLKK